MKKYIIKNITFGYKSQDVICADLYSVAVYNNNHWEMNACVYILEERLFFNSSLFDTK